MATKVSQRGIISQTNSTKAEKESSYWADLEHAFIPEFVTFPLKMVQMNITWEVIVTYCLRFMQL